MNNDRRKRIEAAKVALEAAKTSLEEATSIIETVRDEEQECYYNLSEGLQQTERGQKFEENVSNLEDALSIIGYAYDPIDDIVSSLDSATE